MVNSAITVLALPFLAFLVVVFITWRNKPASAVVTILAMAMELAIAVGVILPATLAGQTDHFEFNWLRLQPGGVPESGTETFLRLGLQVDPLAAIMLVVVTVVSFLVHVY